MRTVVIAAIVAALSATRALAASPVNIQNDNSHAIVYLRVLDEKGGEKTAGSGMIVSHDGYILTASHLSPEPGEKLVARVGANVGTEYPLEFRDKDTTRDIAFWQLPQASKCWHTVVLDNKPLDEAANFVALGFPGDRGLSRAPLHITNAHTPEGFYASDGALEEGYSGGPVFNEAGRVIGLVQGGTISGVHNNDIVPLPAALAEIQKLGVSAGIGHAYSDDAARVFRS